MIFIRRKEFNQLLDRIDHLEKLIYPKGLSYLIPTPPIVEQYATKHVSGKLPEEPTSIMDSIRNIKEVLTRKGLV